MSSLTNISLRITFLLGLMVQAQALEMGLDASFNSSTQVDDWGAATHLQLISDQGFGLDFGYQRYNSITYNALNTSLTHSLDQIEIGTLWQAGDEAFRFQLLAGGVLSNSLVQASGFDLINRFDPGYQVGLGVSVPVFTRVRAFAEAGYQGWLQGEIPNHFHWRYGVRFVFGGNSVQPLEEEEQAQQIAQQEQAQEALENPPVSIDPSVPEYVPSHLSQSLPPILANADLCKCSPAGPYTLQLGEFSNMPQAIRGLEYRGLRQFFNSRTYLRSPLPVFLSQPEEDGPVSVFLGELNSINDMQFWRYELRKNGLLAQFRKVVNGSGERTANVIVEMTEDEASLTPQYSEEDIRRMNSLPETDVMIALPVMPTESETEQLVAEKMAMEAELEANRQLLNQAPDREEVPHVETKLQLGPLTLDGVTALLSMNDMQQAMSHQPTIQPPGSMMMVWDERRQEAWLQFSHFQSRQKVDEWRAWLDAQGLMADSVEAFFAPAGDVYHFALGGNLQPFSVEIDRQDDAMVALQRLRSPEVLWFQAFQRINGEPVETALNWSATDKRYHLIVINVPDRQTQQRIWSDLTAVGLLPSLAEQ